MRNFLQDQGFREPAPKGWDFNLAKRVEEIKELGGGVQKGLRAQGLGLRGKPGFLHVG